MFFAPCIICYTHFPLSLIHSLSLSFKHTCRSLMLLPSLLTSNFNASKHPSPSALALAASTQSKEDFKADVKRRPKNVKLVQNLVFEKWSNSKIWLFFITKQIKKIRSWNFFIYKNPSYVEHCLLFRFYKLVNKLKK